MSKLFENYRGSGRQYQRSATPFERVLDALQVPVQGLSGAVEGIIEGQNPLENAARNIKEDRDFINVLQNQGMDEFPSRIAGTVANIALDPLNYLGVGVLTNTGRAARASKLAFDVAENTGDLAKAFKAAKTIDRVGVFSTKASEQAAAGHRALIEFAGKKVVGGEKVYQMLEKVGARVADTPAAKFVQTAFGGMRAKLPEFVKFRGMQAKAKAGRTVMDLEKQVTAASTEYYDEMAKAGMDAETARDLLRDATERWKSAPENVDLTEYMSPHDRRKYVRLVWQTEAAKRGLPDQLGKNEDLTQFLSRRRRPNVSTPEGIVTEGAAHTEGIVDVSNVDVVAGRKVRRVDKIDVAATGFDKQGRPIGAVGKIGKAGKGFADETGLGMPNLFLLDGAFDFKGQLPQEALELLGKQGFANSAKAVRRLESRAIDTYVSLRQASTLRDVFKKYGWDSQLAKLSPKVARSVSFINAANASFLSAERQSGLRISELIGDLNYLKRIMTPEGRDALTAAMGTEASKMSSAYDVSVRFASQIERDELMRNLTVSEINEMAERGMLAITGNKKVKLFEDEPFFATFRRGSESAKAVEAAKMTKDYIGKYGAEVTGTIDNPVSRFAGAPPGMAFLPDRLAEDLGVRQYEAGRLIKDVALPKDIVDLLQSHYERVLSPAGLQPVLRGYDSLTRMWKNITLPIWPAYQVRNGISDLVMITTGPGEYALSPHGAVGAITDAAMGLGGKAKEIKLGGGVSVTWEQFAEMLHTNGVLDYNPGRDIDDYILRPRGLKNFRKGLSGFEERMGTLQPFDAAVRVSMFRQNSTNAGYFLGLLRKGVPPEVAAMEVKKRLFDFSDLTDVEKQVFRRVAPFYSWLRHNIPYQVGTAVSKPGQLATVGWLRNYMTGGEGPAGDVALPGWLAEGVPIAAGGFGEEGHPSFLRLKGLLPQADLATLGQPLQEALNAVSPLLKTPVEMGANYSFFRNQPLERFPGEQEKVLGVPVSRRFVEPVLDQIRPINEVNNLLRDQPGAQKIAGFMLAKSYPIDKSLQQRLMYFKLEQERTRVKKLIYQAASQGNSGEIQTLRRYLLDLEKNPRQLMK